MDVALLLDGVDTWVNGGPVEPGESDAVLVYTWRYTDMASWQSLDAVAALHDAYRDAGVQVVGIHTPRFPFEADADTVAAAVDRADIPFPVGLHAEMSPPPVSVPGLPHTAVFRGGGRVAAEQTGIGRQVEQSLRQLLRRHGAALDDPVFDDAAVQRRPVPGTVSRDVYAGDGHGVPLGNDHPTAVHTTVTYEEEGDREMGSLYLDGDWRVEDDYAAVEGDGYAAVRFTGRRCGIVAGPAGAEAAVQLYGGPVPDTMYTDQVTVVDGETRVEADRPGLYTVVRRDEPRVAEIEVLPRSDQFRLYAVCFG